MSSFITSSIVVVKLQHPGVVLKFRVLFLLIWLQGTFFMLKLKLKDPPSKSKFRRCPSSDETSLAGAGEHNGAKENLETTSLALGCSRMFWMQVMSALAQGFEPMIIICSSLSYHGSKGWGVTCAGNVDVDLF